MNWDDLRFFVDLSETGSLSATARNLHVDHSTVARRIAALEQALGLRLFDRLPQGYPLTAEGERLKEQASRLRDDIIAIERMAEGDRTGIAGTVRVSAPPAFASFFLVPRLGLVRERHPGIRLEMSGNLATVNLTRREADIAIRMTKPEGASLVARRLGASGYGLFAARSYAARHAVEDMALLGYEENMDHVPQQIWLRNYAAGRPFVFRTSDLGGLYHATRAGLGAAVLPFFLTAHDDSIVCLRRHDVPSRDMWLLVHEDVRRSPRVRAVMDALTEIIQRHRAMIETGLPEERDAG